MSKSKIKKYTKDTKILEMAKEIIELKLQLAKASIGIGNCPFVVSPPKTSFDIDCSTTNCSDCSSMWVAAKRKEITEEVITYYGL